MANVNDMRRGQEFETELTERVEGLASAGYLQILGHSFIAAPEPTVVASPVVTEAPAAPPPAETPKRPPRKKKAPTAEVDDGGSESPA